MLLNLQQKERFPLQLWNHTTVYCLLIPSLNTQMWQYCWIMIGAYSLKLKLALKWDLFSSFLDIEVVKKITRQTSNRWVYDYTCSGFSFVKVVAPHAQQHGKFVYQENC
ncbi:hypothetical protein MKX03_033975 [Papaver bracteatum]|nr:hypothetical protein MKX03_033975 [Papaver bracteatum]